MPAVRWDRLPFVRALPQACDWLQRELEAGLSASTIAAYSRTVEIYLAYCRQQRIDPHAARSDHIAAYLRELSASGLRPATLLQRLAALRLFYAYVVEQSERTENPITGSAVLLLDPPIDTTRQLPWIPDGKEWRNVLGIARAASARTHLMLALSYEAALHREQVVDLLIGNLDLGRRTLRIQEGGGKTRVVHLSATLVERCAAFLEERVEVTNKGERMFLSESPRNRAAPITIWTWSKVVRAIAQQSGTNRFTTHTPRHVRLFDLARDGWSAREIGQFAGLSVGLARLYLRLAAERPGQMSTGTAKTREDESHQILFAKVA